MLRSHNRQDVELEFFTSFLSHAIKHEKAYLEIVEPIILDAAKLARNETTILDIGRRALNIKLILLQCAATQLQAIDNSNWTEHLQLILTAITESDPDCIA
jgi:hypothetical protein